MTRLANAPQIFTCFGGGWPHLNDESAKVAQYVIDIRLRPHTRRAHRLNQIRPSEQTNPTLLLPRRRLHASQLPIDLLLEMVQHLRRLKILAMQRLPRIHADPTALLHRQRAHVDPVLRFHEPGLLVGVADAGEVGADDFEAGVEAGVVGGHFEHAQVQEGDGAEGAAGDEDERGAVGALDPSAQARGGEFVFVEGHVAADFGGHDWRRGWSRWLVEGEEVAEGGDAGADKREGCWPSSGRRWTVGGRRNAAWLVWMAEGEGGSCARQSESYNAVSSRL